MKNILSLKSSLSKMKIIFILIAFLLSILAIYFLINSQVPPKTEHQIIEPDAPLTTNLKIDSFGSILNTAQVNSSKNPVSSPVVSPNPSGQSLIDSIKYIESLRYSPDGKYSLILSWTDDPTKYMNGDPSVTNKPTLKLQIADSNGIIVKKLEDKDVLNADFTDNNQLYYQKLGNDYGVFAYNIDKDKKLKFIVSSDPDTFKNIVVIDETKFFFIQPKTGKYGYGSVLTGDLNVIGQKASANDQYSDVDMAIFSDLIISPDKKQIAFYDNSTTTGFTRKLLVFSSDETQFNTPIYSTSVEQLTSNNSILTSQYHWSSDNQYLTVGTDSTTIDLKNKKVLFKGTQGKFTNINLSPTSKKAIVCESSTQNMNCRLKDLSDSKSSDITLDNDISDIQWVSDDNAVFVIGNSLYDYKVADKKLEKVVTQRANYKILSKERSTNTIIVEQDNTLVGVSLKNN